MINPYDSLNAFNYTPPNGVYWPLEINPVMAPKIEENNPEELKINVKKHQIKFNFAL